MTKLIYDLKLLSRGSAITRQLIKIRVLEFYIWRKNFSNSYEKFYETYQNTKDKELLNRKQIPKEILPKELERINYNNNLEPYSSLEKELFEILMENELSVIRDFLLDDDLDYNIWDVTPKSIVELTMFFLKSLDKDKPLLNLCCGAGTFLYEARRKEVASNYYGVEENYNTYVDFFIKMYLNDFSNVKIYNEDPFSTIDILTNKSTIKFGKAFVDSILRYNPYKNRFDNLADEYKTDNDLPLEKRNTYVFQYMSLMLRNLDQKGKAVIFLIGGALFNSQDQDIRQYMIEKGLIEAVIELPEKMLNATRVKSYLLILSFGNKKIKLVDLSECILEKQRIRNILDVKKAIEIIKDDKDNDFVITYMNSEFEASRYGLCPSKHRNRISIEIKEGQNIEEVCRVFTGWQASSSQLDKLYVNELEINDSEKVENTTHIIQMGDVNDGVILRKNNLYKVEEKQIDKFALRNGDVIISTKSAKVKSAVVEMEEGERIIASGSIMVLRPKNNKINPYFLRSYLDSSNGQKALAIMQTGNIIPNLTVNNVKLIQVPVLPLEEQQNIVKIYKEKQDKIKSLKCEIEKEEKEIESLFDFSKNN